METKTVKKIFRRFAAANPKPTTELQFSSPFELLVAVVLSAQATDTSVNKATARLFSVANTPTQILALGEEKLKQAIKTIGLYNTKAKHIMQLCQILHREHHDQVPNTRQALEALPGVGRKTANVVLNTAFGQATLAVDTHIFRVANRIGLANGKTPRAVEDQLMAIIPKPYLHDAHHWLILHGRYVCTARKPQCQHCLINDLCQYPMKTWGSASDN